MKISQLIKESTNDKFKDIMLYIIDQSIWRSREHGSDLVKNQFEYFDVPFTEQTINQFFDWAHSSQGVKAFWSILKENETYFEWFSPDLNMDEAVVMAFKEEGGLFSEDSRQDEIQKAGKTTTAGQAAAKGGASKPKGTAVIGKPGNKSSDTKSMADRYPLAKKGKTNKNYNPTRETEFEDLDHFARHIDNLRTYGKTDVLKQYKMDTPIKIGKKNTTVGQLLKHYDSRSQYVAPQNQKAMDQVMQTLMKHMPPGDDLDARTWKNL